MLSGSCRQVTSIYEGHHGRRRELRALPVSHGLLSPMPGTFPSGQLRL